MRASLLLPGEAASTIGPMLRAVNGTRAVHEQFVTHALVLMPFLWLAGVLAYARDHEADWLVWSLALSGFVMLFVRHRVEADLQERVITVRWVLSLGPGSPAFELRWLAAHHFARARGVGRLVRTERVQVPDSKSQWVKLYVVGLVPEDAGRSGSLAGLAELFVLSDEHAAVAFARQLAADLGLDDLGDVTDGLAASAPAVAGDGEGRPAGRPRRRRADDPGAEPVAVSRASRTSRRRRA